MMLKKAITVYLDAQDLVFLDEKTSNGYKISAYLRHLLDEAIKKEKGGVDGTK